MARKSIEDIMNEIEDFMNSCRTTALSSNKVVVPRDEFDELFGDLKVKIPAEIDRCKKIMRSKDAILMDARKTADDIIAQAGEQANQMVAETEIMAQANQKAYETVEMARVQANDILAQAVADANEIRLGSMQYTNDMMVGIRDYVQATIEAERANYEHLIERLNNDYMVANANLDEIQNQIVEFTGDPNSVVRSTQPKQTVSEKKDNPMQNMVQKVKQAVGRKETTKEDARSVESLIEPKEDTGKMTVAASDGKTTVAGYTRPANSSKSAKAGKAGGTETITATMTEPSVTAVVTEDQNAQAQIATTVEGKTEGTGKKVKKIVKKRNPVIHTPQTAQETVAKTVEAAKKVDKTVYKANGEQAREVPAMEGRVKRGPRVGRGLVEEHSPSEGDPLESSKMAETVQTEPKSMGMVDDYKMDPK